MKTTSHCLQTEHSQTVGNRAADQVHSMVPWWKQNLTDKNGVRSFCYVQIGGKMVWEHRTWEDVRRSTFLEIPEKQRITHKHCEYLSNTSQQQRAKGWAKHLRDCSKDHSQPSGRLVTKDCPRNAFTDILYTGTSQATRKGATREKPGPPGFHFFADVNPGKAIYYHLTWP